MLLIFVVLFAVCSADPGTEPSTTHHVQTEDSSDSLSKWKDELTKAVQNGDANTTEDLLKKIKNPDSHLLHLAVERGDVRIAKLLLQNDFDVDVKNPATGMTPLCKSAQIGNVDMITLLIENGASVRARNNYGYSPLMLATVWSKVSHSVRSQIVEILIEHGADVNDFDIGGWTALHGIAFRANDDVTTVKLLLEYGANVNARENHSIETPLHKSVHRGNVGISRVLIENGANVNAANRAGITPLHFAATWDRMELAKMLIENGAEVNARNSVKATPLHLIAELSPEDDDEFAEYLIKNGANVTARDFHNQTPYDIARRRGMMKIVRVFEEDESLEN